MSTATLSTEQFIAMEEQYGAHNYHPLDIVIERAEGAWVHDVEGKKYLDCLASYSAVNQGHCHPQILNAMLEQAKKVTLTSRAFRNDQLPMLYKKMNEISGKDKMLPMNSGAEAVETALKMARKWGHTVKGIPENQAEIIVCADNFHGRTISIISFSTDADYKAGFGPFTPGFKVVPFGDAKALKEAITPNTCAFLVEPIQAEAGILIPPAGYLKEVETICKENNVLFMADEIQTGLARTGKMFCFQHDDANPDVIIVGKALSGGFYPVSAVLADDNVMSVFAPGQHGSTYGGNPLGCAVALAAVNVLIDENLNDRSTELGAHFVGKLKSLTAGSIKEIRGKGMLIGIELNTKARKYCEALKAEGVLCKETHDNVIRFAPPLVVSKDDLDWAFSKVEKVFNELG